MTLYSKFFFMISISNLTKDYFHSAIFVLFLTKECQLKFASQEFRPKPLDLTLQTEYLQNISHQNILLCHMLCLYILKVEFYIVTMPMDIVDCWVPIAYEVLTNIWGAYKTSIYLDLLWVKLIGTSYVEEIVKPLTFPQIKVCIPEKQFQKSGRFPLVHLNKLWESTLW